MVNSIATAFWEYTPVSLHPFVGSLNIKDAAFYCPSVFGFRTAVVGIGIIDIERGRETGRDRERKSERKFGGEDKNKNEKKKKKKRRRKRRIRGVEREKEKKNIHTSRTHHSTFISAR